VGPEIIDLSTLPPLPTLCFFSAAALTYELGHQRQRTMARIDCRYSRFSDFFFITFRKKFLASLSSTNTIPIIQSCKSVSETRNKDQNPLQDQTHISGKRMKEWSILVILKVLVELMLPNDTPRPI
jgi:hypothetical protein